MAFLYKLPEEIIKIANNDSQAEWRRRWQCQSQCEFGLIMYTGNSKGSAMEESSSD